MPYVAYKWAAGTSTTTPTHQVGDALIVMAVRWGNATPPSLPAGWTQLAVTSSGTPSVRVGWKAAASTADSTGTWTDAEDLYMFAWRTDTPGAAAIAQAANTIPGLTLTHPGPTIATTGVGYPGTPGTPTGTVSRNYDATAFARWADTNGAVSSWAAQTVANHQLGLSVEMKPPFIHITGELVRVGATAGGHVTGELVRVGAQSQVAHITGELVRVGAQARARITGTLVAIGATSESYGTWRELRYASRWLHAASDPERELSAWAELVDVHGVSQPVIVGKSAARSRLPLSGASVDYRGEQAEQWSADLAFADPWMVPKGPGHPLMGYRQYYVRLWWGVKADGNILEMPVCTVALGNVTVNDDGTVSGSVRGRDVLSLARGGYGQPLNVGGLTCDVAIRAIFERVAPTLALRIAPSSVTLPADMVLHEEDPAKDWTDIAAMGWADGVVRSDREGVIVVGPRPDPILDLDWAEGPDCPVSELSREHAIEHMGNQLTAISTHADAVGLYVTVQDDDPSSPTYVGGPMGVRPLPDLETDKATTEEALRSLALMHLGRGLHPVEDVRVRVPQRPGLEYQQRIRLARSLSGVDATYRVSSWSMVLPVAGVGPGPMTVGMMARTVRDA